MQEESPINTMFHKIYRSKCRSNNERYGNRLIDVACLFRWLSVEIQEYLSGIQEKMKSLKRAQDRMVRKVNAATRLALQNTRLEVYGSTTTGLALPSSDIDCVLVPIVEEESPANHELQEVLESLKKIQAQVLAQASDCAYDFHLIDTAKIPILKFTMRASSWETRFDVTCSKSSEHSGIRTREMVLSFMGVMPAIRPLVLILKSQLVSQGICFLHVTVNSF
jgi:DNA polymerase sigma